VNKIILNWKKKLEEFQIKNKNKFNKNNYIKDNYNNNFVDNIKNKKFNLQFFPNYNSIKSKKYSKRNHSFNKNNYNYNKNNILKYMIYSFQENGSRKFNNNNNISNN
jgi:hypothetical protein